MPVNLNSIRTASALLFAGVYFGAAAFCTFCFLRAYQNSRGRIEPDLIGWAAAAIMFAAGGIWIVWRAGRVQEMSTRQTESDFKLSHK